MLDDFHHRTRHGAVRRRHRRAAAGDACRTRSATALVNVFGAPPVEGLGTAGGFKIVDRGPRRHRAWTRCRTSPSRSSPTGDDDAGPARACSPASAPTRPWLYLDIDRDRGQDDGRVDGRGLQHAAGLPRLALRQRLQPLRPDLAGQRAGRRRASASRSRTCKQLKVRNDKGEMVPLGAFAERPRRERAGDDRCATTCTPPAAINGNAGAGHQLRPGDRAAGGGRPAASLPPSMRTEWTELALLQLQTGNTAMLRLPAGGGAGVPGAGGAVRELVAAAGGDPGRADVPALLDRPACMHGADGHQHLHADRLRRAGRPGVQERDPDRRVRQGAARGGRRPLRRRRWRRAGCGCGRS